MKIYPCGEEVKKDEFSIDGDQLKYQSEGVYERKYSPGMRVILLRKGDDTVLFVLTAEGILEPPNWPTSVCRYRHLPNARVCLEIK